MASSGDDSSQVWTSDSSQYLSVMYDDTHLVYFKPSGETHFLNFLSFGLIDVLSEKSLTIDGLHELIQDRFSLTADDIPKSLLISTLAELDLAGLVSSKRVKEKL